jgi:hypothetical protein
MTPSQSRGPVLPIVGLAILTIIVSTYSAIAGYRGAEPSDQSSYLWAFGFSLFVAWWVEADRKLRAISAPFEYAAAVFFAWPILLPLYLYKSRGAKGLVCGISIVLGYSIPFLVEYGIFLAVRGK